MNTLNRLQLILLESQTHTNTDSLIYWQAETLIKVTVFVIIIVASLIIRVITSRLENAIVFAVFTSITTLAFLLIH